MTNPFIVLIAITRWLVVKNIRSKISTNVELGNQLKVSGAVSVIFAIEDCTPVLGDIVKISIWSCDDEIEYWNDVKSRPASLTLSVHLML